MDEDLHHIDDLFRKGMEDFEDLPSSAVWEKLDKNLDKRKVVSISRKYNKLKWVAAALFIFSAATGMYTWNMRSKYDREMVSNNASGERTPASENLEAQGSGNVAGMDNDLPELDSPAISQKTGDQSNGETGLKNLNDHVSSRPTPENPKSDQKETVGVVNTAHRNDRLNHKAKLSPEAIASSAVAPASSLPRHKKVQNDLVGRKATEWRKSALTSGPKLQTASIGNDGSASVSSNRPLSTPEHESASVSGTHALAAREPVNERLITVIPSPGMLPRFRSSSFKSSDLPAISIRIPVRPRLTITPFYAFDAVRSRVTNTHFRFREEDRREIKSKEETGNASTKGIFFNLALNNNWSIGSGIALSTMTTTIKPKLIFARPDNMGHVNYRINCSAGYTVVKLKSGAAPIQGDSIQALTSKNQLDYFNIPLNLRYKIGAGKLTLLPEIGMAMNFLTKASIHTEVSTAGALEKMSSDNIEGTSTAYLSGSLGMGLNYAFSKTFAITILPSTSMGMSSINTNAPVRTFLSKTSLGLGFSVSL